jgi:hypothetical protein
VSSGAGPSEQAGLTKGISHGPNHCYGMNSNPRGKQLTPGGPLSKGTIFRFRLRENAELLVEIEELMCVEIEVEVEGGREHRAALLATRLGGLGQIFVTLLSAWLC